MSTEHQRKSYFNTIQSGQATTQAQAVERYLSCTGLATTRMVAVWLGRPMSTATRALDSLYRQGKVTKEVTDKGRTGWRYEPDPDKWPGNVRRAKLEKVRRAIRALRRADEEAGGVVPGHVFSSLALLDEEIERTVI